VRFFRGVSAVREQLAAADGLAGYTLRAKPLARDNWTLSVWTDETALREFMRTAPHVRLMTSLKPFMGPTKFVTWTISAADGRLSLVGALERLASGQEPIPAAQVSERNRTVRSGAIEAKLAGDRNRADRRQCVPRPGAKCCHPGSGEAFRSGMVADDWLCDRPG